jgi:hypothetical protein
MNDADIAKMIKQMPADMVAESAEFAGNSLKQTKSVKKSGIGDFFRRPAFSVAISAVLFIVSAAIVTGLIFKNRSARSDVEGDNEPAGTAVPTAITLTPAPGEDPAGAVLADLSAVRGDRGTLQVNDKTDKTEFLEKWKLYVEDFLVSASEPIENPTRMYMDYRSKLSVSADSDEVYWTDISPEGIKGIGQIFRCEGEFSSDTGNKHFTLDVLFADGEVVYVFPKVNAEITVQSVVPINIEHSAPGLLGTMVSNGEGGTEYVVWAYYPVLKRVQAKSLDAQKHGISVMNVDGDAYVVSAFFDENEEKEQITGGKVVYDGSVMTIGGVKPAEFFAKLFSGQAAPAETDVPEPTATAVPTPTQAVTEPATATVPTPTQAATGPATAAAPTPTQAATEPAATPTPGTDKTAAPGATPVPSEDPSNVMTLADRMSLITVSHGSGSITGLSFSKGYYMFDGNTMKYVDMSSTAEYLASEAMRMLTASYKKGTLPSITVEKDFYILLTNDSELVSIDVWAVNGAANADNVVPELIARGLSEAEFRAFIASGSMQFRLDPDTGEALPCFAVMTAKKNCTYFDVIGEYEYFLKTTIVPFSTSVPQSSETIRLLRYNWDGSGVGIKEISQCELNDSIVRLLKNAKLTNQKFEKISDEVVNEFSDDLPVAPGTMWVETSFGIYRISPDLKVLCKVSSHLGEGQVLEMPVMLTTALHQAWDYYPYDYYTVEYDIKAGVSTLNHVFDAGSEIELERVLVYSDSGTLHSGKALVSVTSNIDQTVTVVLECMRSADFLGKGDTKTVSLRAGTWEDIELEFEGWDDAQFYIYLTFESKRIEVKVIP